MLAVLRFHPTVSLIKSGFTWDSDCFRDNFSGKGIPYKSLQAHARQQQLRLCARMRVKVRRNGQPTGGKLIAVPDTFEGLLSRCLARVRHMLPN